MKLALGALVPESSRTLQAGQVWSFESDYGVSIVVTLLWPLREGAYGSWQTLVLWSESPRPLIDWFHMNLSAWSQVA